MSDLYVFDNPKSESDIEWAGAQIGLSNLITRTKSRTKEYDKTVDQKPGVYESLMKSVNRCLGDKELFIHDVIIHGIRVRSHTNSKHLIDFWKVNWFSVQEWTLRTGQKVEDQPQVNVYAFGNVPEQKEAAYYSRGKNTIIFFNTAYYGQLKSWVLGAAGWVLANKYGIHSIHGAAVEKDGRGVLYIAPTGTGKSTSTYGLMSNSNTRFHSDDWVYVRYGYKLNKSDKYAHVYNILGESGVEGYRVHKWIEQNKGKAFKCKALTLDNEEVELGSSDLDLNAPIRAFAYISEKVFYLRSNLVESFPVYTGNLLRSRLENVPNVTAEYLAKEEEKLNKLVPIAKQDKALKDIPDQKLKEQILRLMSFDNARAMLDIKEVFGENRSFTNPLEPLHLSSIFLLKRNFQEDLILKDLGLSEFCSRLMIGLTPQGKKEIAYNAYRAVDEGAESKYVQYLEGKTPADRNVYDVYVKDLQANNSVPDTFYAEFELFRVMNKSAKCYDLNTVLQKKYPNLRDAVLKTIDLIADILGKLPEKIHLTVKDI